MRVAATVTTDVSHEGHPKEIGTTAEEGVAKRTQTPKFTTRDKRTNNARLLGKKRGKPGQEKE